MLENAAVSLLELGQWGPLLTQYPSLAVAGAVAVALDRRDDEIARVPYFVRCLMPVPLLMIMGNVWGMTATAIIGGYFWVVVATSIAVSLFAGFVIGRLAAARSRDAFGHSWAGLFAFLPLANLWLLFKPSRFPVSAHRAPVIPILTGWRGVLLGVLIIVGGRVIANQADWTQLDAKLDMEKPEVQRAVIRVGVKTQGLEPFLKATAAGTALPINIDKLTTLKKMEAVGRQLVRTFSIDVDSGAISAELERTVKQEVCSAAGLDELIRQGATIVDVYLDGAGRELGTVSVDRLDCVNGPAA